MKCWKIQTCLLQKKVCWCFYYCTSWEVAISNIHKHVPVRIVTQKQAKLDNLLKDKLLHRIVRTRHLTLWIPIEFLKALYLLLLHYREHQRCRLDLEQNRKIVILRLCLNYKLAKSLSQVPLVWIHDTHASTEPIFLKRQKQIIQTKQKL